jgi:hypothetical protein
MGAIGGDAELIGGFADEDLLDDSQERAIATLSKSKGKQPIEVCHFFYHKDDYLPLIRPVQHQDQGMWPR